MIISWRRRAVNARLKRRFKRAIVIHDNEEKNIAAMKNLGAVSCIHSEGSDAGMEAPSELNGRLQRAVCKNMQSVVRVAYAYVRNVQDAEDIAQDTFLAYLQNRVSFVSDEHEKAWLIRVCVNKCKNLLKSGWHKSRAPLCEELAQLPQEESELLLAVMGLDEKYRLPVHLHYYEGYDIREIAGLLSLPYATVGTRLARARTLIKRQLGGAMNA